ncbi:MAG: 50S ribosomal protein L5 [Rhabdochlamydiaceae bacterium]|nr:50S ribosomal protein L5 [Rhabdochlamydiaceae bacterium]
MSRLQQKYKEVVKPGLQEKFKYPNPMLLPALKKIVISMGTAEASKDKNALQDCLYEMTLLSGQKPILTRAKKSVANFKLREGQAIGIKVTLRKKRMFDFFDRLCNIVSPRIRDFRGFPLKCDGQGNYSLGIEEQQIFPEIDLDKVKRTQGMNITFVTTARSDEECLALLQQLGLPFKVEE